MPFCSKHQHAYVNVCSECVVEEQKLARSTTIELVAEPVVGKTIGYRGCIKRAGAMVYSSRHAFDSTELALRHAAQVFLGHAPGYRHGV